MYDLSVPPPNGPLSVDGLPLLGEALDYDFAHRISAASPYAFFLDWRVPVLGVAFYLLALEPLFDALRRASGVERNGATLKGVVFVHNCLLAVYSGWSAYHTWPVLVGAMQRGGFGGLHCDRDVWRGEGGFGSLAVIFYVSKYYEFLDSAILVLKNSDGKHAPSFLQKYHHAGIVLCMYCSVVAESNWMIFAVALNSTIHLFMYTYYAAATLGYRSPLAKVLTTCQMIQFILGIALAGGCYFYDPCASATTPSKLACGLTQVYAVGLLYLFNEMSKRKYGKRA